jgi:putative peptidoglycan lipid II flippase
MVPATFGLAAVQINIVVDTTLASRMGDGPITWLQLGFRLMQLPLGLIGAAIATANLAFVSRDAAGSDREGLRANLATSMRAAGLWTLPATAGLIALREPIVAVIFEHGEFTTFDTARTAAAAACYALGLYAYSLTKIQVPVFYALGESRTPVAASATAVAFKIAANFLLIAWLARLGLPPFLGLALSTAISAWVNLALLSRALRRRLGRLSRYGVVSTTVKMAAVSVVMGVACRLFHRGLGAVAGGGGFPGEILRLAGAIGVGLVLVAVGVRLLGIPEAVRMFRPWAGPRGGDRW